ncbi:MAG TPA: peptidase domain-containing protein [Methanoregula sp.]|nr:peptidase domain-containing protein [Methanoregula sp.]
MSKRLGIVALVLLVMASCAVVSAQEQGNVVSGNGYQVQPAQDEGMTPMSIQTIYSTITQGTTNRHAKVVSSYITTLNVDLNWGKTTNSLQLKIYSPDGYTFGPYYDNADGSINGRINLDITNSNGIAQGTWYYEVYGYSVSGTQAYTI